MAKYMDGPVADPYIVRQFANRLIEAYEQFVNDYPGKVDYIDGLMAAHNFYVNVIEHLIEETGEDIWRVAAVSTLQQAMERE